LKLTKDKDLDCCALHIVLVLYWWCLCCV